MYLVFIGEPEAELEASAWFDDVEQAIASGLEPTTAEQQQEQGDFIRFESLHSEGEYLEKIRTSQNEITDGETYEVCLTNHTTAPTTVEPFEYYKKLRDRNPAPCSAFLKYPELSVACSSPERFLKINHEKVAETKPIKGTSRRGKNEEEDNYLKRVL